MTDYAAAYRKYAESHRHSAAAHRAWAEAERIMGNLESVGFYMALATSSEENAKTYEAMALREENRDA